MSLLTGAGHRDALVEPAVRGTHAVSFWLLVASVMALCYFAQPLDLFYTVGGGASVDSHIRRVTEGTPARQLSLLLMGAWAAAWIVARRSAVRLDACLTGPAMAFLFIAVASVGWSDDPWPAARRAAALLTFAVCCAAFAQVVRLEDVTALAFWGSALAVGAGAGAELALGTFAPFDSGYRFSGLMHANVQGVYCACLTLAGVSLARRGPPRAVMYASAAGIGFAFLLLTKSRASLASVLAGVTLYFALTSARARYWLLVASTALALAAVPLLFAETSASAAMRALLSLGREDDASTVVTLTGRTELWRSLLQYVYARPLLGFGYGGFWTPERLTALIRREGWVFGSAHSQYLEILLSVGVLGLVAYCATGLAAFWSLLSRFWSSHADGYAFGAALVLLTAVDMLTNSLPLEPSLPMVLCLTVVAGLALVDRWPRAALRR